MRRRSFLTSLLAVPASTALIVSQPAEVTGAHDDRIPGGPVLLESENDIEATLNFCRFLIRREIRSGLVLTRFVPSAQENYVWMAFLDWPFVAMGPICVDVREILGHTPHEVFTLVRQRVLLFQEDMLELMPPEKWCS